jgi:hypothetical protein
LTSALTKLTRTACASASSRWRLGIGDISISRLRIGVVALVHVGIVALRLGIAALAQLERARDNGALQNKTAGNSSMQ